MSLSKMTLRFAILVALVFATVLTGCDTPVPESKGVEAPGGAQPVASPASPAGGGSSTPAPGASGGSVTSQKTPAN